MPKVLVFVIPGQGHVNPTLPVIRGLVEQGEQVSYYVSEEMQAAVESTGATFQPYETKLFQVQQFFQADANVPLPFRMVEESQHVLPQVLERARAERPDYVIYDGLCMWGGMVAEVLRVPAISFRPSYVFTSQMGRRIALDGQRGLRARAWGLLRTLRAFRHANTGLAELRAQYGLPPMGMQAALALAEPLNIVTMPRSFQPGGESFDQRYQFVGACLDIRPNQSGFPIEQLRGKKNLFISLGTVFNSRPDFFKTCFEAFGGSDWQVIMAYGSRLDPAHLGPVPDNFLVASFVPQLEVLQHSALFITHGGMNSTMEALYYGVPLIVAPQMGEQALTAGRVQELGLGVQLRAESITSAALRAAVAQVSSDTAIRQRVNAMQQDICAAGGTARAVELVLDYARRA